MSKTDQLSFLGFESDVAPKTAIPAIPAKPAKAMKPPSAPAPVAPVSPVDTPALAAVPATDAEAMAQTLAQHHDFRVLRRLQPVADYGGLQGQATQRVIVLDTETTGLDNQSELIIELAMLAVEVDTATGLPVGLVDKFDKFEDPKKPIPPDVVKLTKITDEKVKGQVINDDEVATFVKGDVLIVAHNSGFDRPFVEKRFPIFKDKRWACSWAGIDWKAEGKESAKLVHLAADCKIFYEAHSALEDCHALIHVLSTPLSDGQTGLARLLAGAGQTRYKLRATGAPFESKDKLKARGYRWDAEGRVWWCSLASEALLAAECEWLRAEVYGRRQATVQLEALDSRVQFSSRPGQFEEREV